MQSHIKNLMKGSYKTSITMVLLLIIIVISIQQNNEWVTWVVSHTFLYIYHMYIINVNGEKTTTTKKQVK
jgi:hypothetical protein